MAKSKIGIPPSTNCQPVFCMIEKGQRKYFMPTVPPAQLAAATSMSSTPSGAVMKRSNSGATNTPMPAMLSANPESRAGVARSRRKIQPKSVAKAGIV